MKLEDAKKLLGAALNLAETISPQIAAAVKAGTILVEVYDDFEAGRLEIAKLAAQDKVTKDEIDALDDSIQARAKRIAAIE